jgi:glucan 1,3-beta-glucosidase
MVESETLDGEPFRPEITWKYFLLALSWARKYGLRVNLDLHSIPGSQNGYNHSSKYGTINFLNGIMGWANYQRTRNYIRTLGEFISTPEYENVVGIFSILNEPRVDVIGRITLRGW